jgi:hypothetical protein
MDASPEERSGALVSGERRREKRAEETRKEDEKRNRKKEERRAKQRTEQNEEENRERELKPWELLGPLAGRSNPEATHSTLPAHPT